MSHTIVEPTIENFLEFARKKDPDEEYIYEDNCKCPVAQFLQDANPEAVHVVVGVANFDIRFSGEEVETHQFDDLIEDQLHRIPQSWGALVRRIETVTSHQV